MTATTAFFLRPTTNRFVACSMSSAGCSPAGGGPTWRSGSRTGDAVIGSRCRLWFVHDLDHRRVPFRCCLGGLKWREPRPVAPGPRLSCCPVGASKNRGPDPAHGSWCLRWRSCRRCVYLDQGTDLPSTPLPVGASRGALMAQMRRCIAVRSLLCAGWLVAGHRAGSVGCGRWCRRSLRPPLRRCQAGPTSSCPHGRCRAPIFGDPPSGIVCRPEQEARADAGSTAASSSGAWPSSPPAWSRWRSRQGWSPTRRRARRGGCGRWCWSSSACRSSRRGRRSRWSATMLAGLVAGGLAGTLVAGCPGWARASAAAASRPRSATQEGTFDDRRGGRARLQLRRPGGLDGGRHRRGASDARHGGDNEPQISADGDSLRVSVEGGGFIPFTEDSRQEWDVVLPTDATLDLTVDANAASSQLDLEDADLSSLAIDANAGDVDLGLPGPQRRRARHRRQRRLALDRRRCVDAPGRIGRDERRVARPVRPGRRRSSPSRIEDDERHVQPQPRRLGLTRSGDTWSTGEGDADISLERRRQRGELHAQPGRRLRMNRRLTRSRDAMVGGVAAGVADWIGTPIRRSCGSRGRCSCRSPAGAALLAYIVAWIVVPEEPRHPAAGRRRASRAPTPSGDADPAASGAAAGAPSIRDGPRCCVGGGLVLIGLWFLVREYLPDINWGLVWPLAARRGRSRDPGRRLAPPVGAAPAHSPGGAAAGDQLAQRRAPTLRPVSDHATAAAATTAPATSLRPDERSRSSPRSPCGGSGNWKA